MPPLSVAPPSEITDSLMPAEPSSAAEPPLPPKPEAQESLPMSPAVASSDADLKPVLPPLIRNRPSTRLTSGRDAVDVLSPPSDPLPVPTNADRTSSFSRSKMPPTLPPKSHAHHSSHLASPVPAVSDHLRALSTPEPPCSGDSPVLPPRPPSRQPEHPVSAPVPPLPPRSGSVSSAYTGSF
jgi:hypothetical protein